MCVCVYVCIHYIFSRVCVCVHACACLCVCLHTSRVSFPVSPSWLSAPTDISEGVFLVWVFMCVFMVLWCVFTLQGLCLRVSVSAPALGCLSLNVMPARLGPNIRSNSYNHPAGNIPLRAITTAPRLWDASPRPRLPWENHALFFFLVWKKRSLCLFLILGRTVGDPFFFSASFWCVLTLSTLGNINSHLQLWGPIKTVEPGPCVSLCVCVLGGTGGVMV